MIPHHNPQYAGHNLIFVIGSPRSGTTWMQRLLTCHEDITTGQESGLFDSYIGPQIRVWERDLDVSTSGRNGVGLGCYHENDAFYTLLKEYALKLMEPMLSSLQPEELFLEKTPSHALFIPEILKLFPDARFIHVLRDGRDVAASLLAASKSWGKPWAPRTAKAAGQMWVRHVTAVRQHQTMIPKENFLEVRYEHMRNDAFKEMQRVVVDFIGLDWDDEQIAAAITQNTVGKTKQGTSIPLGGEFAKRTGTTEAQEPKGFIRKAQVGSWRHDLSGWDKFSLWVTTRGTMNSLGYPWPTPWA